MFLHGGPIGHRERRPLYERLVRLVADSLLCRISLVDSVSDQRGHGRVPSPSLALERGMLPWLEQDLDSLQHCVYV